MHFLLQALAVSGTAYLGYAQGGKAGAVAAGISATQAILGIANHGGTTVAPTQGPSNN